MEQMIQVKESMKKAFGISLGHWEMRQTSEKLNRAAITERRNYQITQIQW